MLDQGWGDAPRLELLVARVRGEYGEMPGLRVTAAQASWLWQVEGPTCEVLLDHLVEEGFLRRRTNGYYVVAEDWR
jgi:hypothetical protein